MKFLQQPVDPFPDPIHAGQEIEFVGLMFAGILLLLILMILMIYLYMIVKDAVPILITYLFSIIIGFASMNVTVTFIPFNPYFQIFFILIQTSFLIMSALDYQTKRKGLKNV